jgi:mono/diheme cytochrome c family protein
MKRLAERLSCFFLAGILLAVGLHPIFASQLSAQDASDRDFFQTQVEPLLQEKCFGCHSHDSGSMEGGLTLDSRSGWEAGGDRGPAVLPGEPDQSLLVVAIRHGDTDLQMPLDEKLSDAEIDILIRWIERGAFDPRQTKIPERDLTDWWSLKALSAPSVPGAGHPIDAFIQSRLQEQNLSPASPADSAVILRRLYIDLHGLQPSPQQVRDWVATDSPQAYAELIDRLLESPRYGEHWARHWLDTIHFADSHGCEHDVKRPYAWRYRDYVIQRLNDDVSWDSFIREQLAADVFYPDQPQLMAGLGFIAAGPLELSRAGTAPIAFDYLDRDDMVTQTMAAFVSSTANCARCHTHKFDPITQEDYYALQAVFAGVGKGDIQFDTSPEILRQRRKLEQIIAAAATGNANVLLQPEYSQLISDWEAARKNEPARWHLLKPDVYVSAGGATLTRQSDGAILASDHLPDQETYTVTAPVDLGRLTAIRLEVLSDPSLPHNGPGRADNGNLHLSEVGFQYFSPDRDTPVPLKISRTTADFDQQGWTSAQAIDGDLQTGWAIYPQVNQSHEIVFELADPIDLVSGGKLAVRLKQFHPLKHVIGKFRLSVTDAPRGSADALSKEVSQILDNPVPQRSQQEAVMVAAIALKAYADREWNALPPQETVYGASAYWSHAQKLASPQKPKTVHLLLRGAFDKPVREVQPGALSALAHLPGRFDLEDPRNEAQRRAALADWLAHRDNPLTWRSIVNRVWQYHFGKGLCNTPNDFGRMGSEPSNVALLDWLAVWFRDEAKGSLKELHRLILTSETWKQSSQIRVKNDDSQNLYLWRMNRTRMDAETFRDSVLKIAGRLDLTMGGPGVEQFVKTQGPQTTPTLDYSAFDWNASAKHRRSIYRVVWRGIPDPFMEQLDFPDLGILAPKRGFSVSPLQSLSLYNNDFVLHSSEWIAQRIQQEQRDLNGQVTAAVQWFWLRPPNDEEQEIFVTHAEKHGLAAFCRVLMNSNEFLFVD